MKRLFGLLITTVLCLALLTVAVSAATAWDGSTAEPSGAGTSTDPYLIASGANLAWLAQTMPTPSESAAVYIKLTADILLNDGSFDQSGNFTKTGETATSTPRNWTPIPKAAWHVDGNNKTISGLYLNCNDSEVGLFSYLYSGAEIKDLTIKNSYVTSTQSSSTSGKVGVFAGRSFRTTVTNCFGDNNTISTSVYVTGGIIGWASQTDFNGVHTSGSITGRTSLGGLVGRAVDTSSFKNCWNEADITTTQTTYYRAGGLVAEADNNINFYNCVNLGSLSGGSRVGGIVAEGGGQLKNCYGLSDIQGYGSEWYSDGNGWRYFWRVGTLSGGSTDTSLSYAEDGFARNDNGETGVVPHFTGKGKLTANGDENELLNALNENLYDMDGMSGLKQWVKNAAGYPLPTGTLFVDTTVYYDIWLDGVRVGERNASNILKNGLASYDKTTNTLYLHDGLTVTKPYMEALLYCGGSINLCIDGNVTFNSNQNVGGGPSVIDLGGEVGGSGTLHITTPTGESANILINAECSEYGLDVGTLKLDGDICMTIRTKYIPIAFASTITLTSSKAVLDVMSIYGNRAMLNPVYTINLPTQNPQKLYEGNNEPLTCVTSFTTQTPEDEPFMYPRIRIASEAYSLTATLPTSLTVSMATANNASAITTWATNTIRAVNGITASNSEITVSDVAPAAAGVYGTPNGTNGSFKVTVKLTVDGISQTKTIPGTITATAYVPPTIVASMRVGTVDAVTGGFTAATGTTFTCLDPIVFAVSYTANGAAVKTLTGGSVTCFNETKPLTWSEANGCYLTAEFTCPTVGPYTAAYSIGNSGEFEEKTDSMSVTVEGLTLTAADFRFVPPTNLYYDASSKSASFEFIGSPACSGTLSVRYTCGGSPVTAPTAEGTYTVLMDVAASSYYKAATGLSSESWTFTISKLPAGVDRAPYAATLTYNGTPQALAIAGYATGGTILYSTEEDGTYSETVPQRTNADNYTVYWYVRGDGIYADGEKSSFPVRIAPKSIRHTDVTVVPITPQTYSGSGLTPVPAVTDGQTALAASTDFTTAYENNRIVGTATVTVSGTGNYTDTRTLSFTIDRKQLTALDFSDITVSKVYDGTCTAGELSGRIGFNGKCGEDDVAITAVPSDYAADAVNAGEGKSVTLTLSLTGSAAANYLLGDETYTFTAATITKANGNITAPTGKSGLIYRGTAQTLLETAATSTTGNIRYSLNGIDYTPDLPTAIHADDYTIYCKSVGDNNHKDAAAQPLAVRIDPKTITVTACNKRISIGDDLPSLDAPTLTKDYTVAGLIGNDRLTTAPTLTYDPSTPNLTLVGDAARILASHADAGADYAIEYASGVLQVVRRTTSEGKLAESYPIRIVATAHGTVNASATKAESGDRVTLTATASSGYVLQSLSVTSKNGKAVALAEKTDGTYTFDMPASAVEVEATFKKENAQRGFADVPEDVYYFDAVQWATEQGIVSGIDATHFAPDAACTRAETFTLLWRGAGSPKAEDSANPFVDIKADAYYYDAVLWAVKNGLTVGTSATTFSPDAPCTRAQIVTLLWRVAGSPKVADTVNPFADVKTDAYYRDAVLWAIAEKLTVGTSAAAFSPDVPCTRAQIVTFLYRAQ